MLIGANINPPSVAEPWPMRMSERFGLRQRRRRAGLLASLIDSIDKRPVQIADLGGRQSYWAPLLAAGLISANIDVSLINPEQAHVMIDRDPRFSHVKADACELEAWPSGSFDLAHSNSTIEHVGSWERKKSFARHLRRLAPCYFVQTPYFWFPAEPHALAPFIHWLPDPLVVGILRRRDIGYWEKAPDIDAAKDTLAHNRLLDHPEFRHLFPDSEITFERFCGLRKSMMAVKRQ